MVSGGSTWVSLSLVTLGRVGVSDHALVTHYFHRAPYSTHMALDTLCLALEDVAALMNPETRYRRMNQKKLCRLRDEENGRMRRQEIFFRCMI